MDWKIFLLLLLLGISISLAIYIYSSQEKTEEKLPFLKPETIDKKANKTSSDVRIIIISETEYIPNETGQFIIRLSKPDTSPITNSVCYASVFYPNKTVYITNQTMSNSPIVGNKYITFTIPDTYGIYEEEVLCYVNVSNLGIVRIQSSSSFHVNPLAETINEINVTLNENYSNLTEQLKSVNNTIISVNQTLSDEIYDLNITIWEFRSYVTIRLNQIETKIDDIINRINRLILNIQKSFENFLRDLVGTAKSIQRGAVTEAECSLWERILGTCP